jgi:hypothetical protein
VTSLALLLLAQPAFGSSASRNGRAPSGRKDLSPCPQTSVSCQRETTGPEGCPFPREGELSGSGVEAWQENGRGKGGRDTCTSAGEGDRRGPHRSLPYSITALTRMVLGQPRPSASVRHSPAVRAYHNDGACQSSNRWIVWTSGRPDRGACLAAAHVVARRCDERVPARDDTPPDSPQDARSRPDADHHGHGRTRVSAPPGASP